MPSQRIEEILADPESGWAADYYDGAAGNLTISESGYDLIHRVLTGDWEDLDAPLSTVIWAGRELPPPYDANWCYLSSQDVAEVSGQLAQIDEARLLELFRRNYVDDEARGFVRDQRDSYRAWLTEDFAKVKAFYAAASAAREAVLKDIG